MEQGSMNDLAPQAAGGGEASPEEIAGIVEWLRESAESYRAELGLDNHRRVKADARYRELMFSPEAIELVRSRERAGYHSTPGIPLYCTGHRTGVALVLMVDNEIDEGTPVPDHIVMLCRPDRKARAAGAAAQGKSYTIQCGTCGRPTSRQDAWLLETALKCLVAADTQKGKGYRITIT
jgi:hypothetical protein